MNQEASKRENRMAKIKLNDFLFAQSDNNYMKAKEMQSNNWPTHAVRTNRSIARVFLQLFEIVSDLVFFSVLNRICMKMLKK